MINNKTRNFITVITVVYNDVKSIEETILSILEQDYKYIEFIIIDGESFDGTTEIIGRYKNEIKFWITEKDNGIYDAMNKGIKLATGDYTCFLNAGDKFYSNETLSKLVKEINNEDVIYGHTCILSGKQKSIRNAYSLNNDWKTIPYCHQSAFIKTNLLKINLFDVKFVVAADYNQYHALKKSNANFKKIDQVISIYDSEGFSNKNYQKLLKEYRRISMQNSTSILTSFRANIYFRLRAIFFYK